MCDFLGTGLETNMGASDTADKATAGFIWKVIGRYDTYITSIVTKAALLGTFDTFVLGAVVLKWKEIVDAFVGHPHLMQISGFFIVAGAVCTLISLYFLLRAVYPFLYSEEKPGEYHSQIFFMHVAKHQSGDAYCGQVMKTDEETRITDLCLQAHALALGLSKKQNVMQKAVLATLIALGAICGFLACVFVRAVIF
jgi:hypothetical protein